MVEAKQYGERVNIVKYIRVEKKWRFAAVVEKRGRVIRDQVWIARRKEHHPEGRYFLEWYQGGKRRRHSVGAFENVIDGARRKAIELGAIKAGLIRPQAEQSCDDEIRISIATAIDSYLDLVKHHRSLRTYRTYRYTLDTLLRQSYAKKYVDQVERQDILNFMTDLMPLNHSETSRKKGAVRGRESRNQSLNTKLTRTEFVAVETASEADGRAIGEWVREAVLKAARTSSVGVRTDHLMTEIVALQLFLTDVLSPVACGERMTPDQYQVLMRNVKTNKHRAAREVIAQYIAENEEERHA